MAIDYIGEIETAQKGTDNLGVGTYSHDHIFKSARSDTSFDIFADTNCPQVGEVHGSDTDARVHARSVVRVDRIRAPGGAVRLQWVIRASFSTDNEIYENPLLEPAEIWITGEQYQKPAELNRAGNVIVNTANTPVKGLNIQQTRPIFNIRKNVSTSALSFITDGSQMDYLNSAGFTIDGNSIGVNFCKWKFIGLSKRKIRNGVSFKVLDHQMHLRDDKWKLHFPNEGLYQVNPVDPEVSGPWPTFDGTGAQGTVPMPLTAGGVQLASTDPADVITLDEDVYKEFDFNTFSAYWT